MNMAEYNRATEIIRLIDYKREVIALWENSDCGWITVTKSDTLNSEEEQILFEDCIMDMDEFSEKSIAKLKKDISDLEEELAKL